MIVHLLDGTYELFRHFYGRRRATGGRDQPLGAVAGVLHTVLETIETDATHLGVATDHVIESFRNRLPSLAPSLPPRPTPNHLRHSVAPACTPRLCSSRAWWFLS